MNDLKRLFGYMGPYRRDMALGMLLVVVESAFEMVIPILMSDIIDQGVAHGDVREIGWTGVEMAVCAVLALITGLLYARYAARASYGFGARIRQAEYAKVQAYAFGNLDHFETSSLITRMTTDVTVVQNAINGGFRPMVRGPAMLVLGVALSFYMSPSLAAVFFVCAPVLGVILFFIVRRIAPLYARLQQAMDHLNTVVQECLTAIRAVKAFVRGEYEEEKFQAVNTELMDVSMTTFRTAVLNLPAFQLTMYAAMVSILWFGGNMILQGSLTVGRLTSFLSYVLQVMNSLMMISNVFLLMTRSLASAHRIAAVLDEPVELANPAHPVTEIPDGGVAFEPGAGGGPGRAGVRPDRPAGRGGHRAAKERPVFGHRAGKSALGQPRRQRRGAVGRLPGGLRRRISAADARRPGRRPGPGGRQRVGRAEAAAVHRPHPAEKAPGPDL